MIPLHHSITQEERISQESRNAPENNEAVGKGNVERVRSIDTTAYLDGNGTNASHPLEDDRAQGGDWDVFEGGLDNWKESGALTEIVRDFLLLALEDGSLHGSQRTDVEALLTKCAEMEGVDVSSYANATKYRGPPFTTQQATEIFNRWQQDCLEPYLAGVDAAARAELAAAEAEEEALRKEFEAAEKDAHAAELKLAIVKLQFELAEKMI